MKHIKSINELFGFDKPKEGDEMIKRIIEIIKEEDIEIIFQHPYLEDWTRFEFTIDDKLYLVNKYDTFLSKAFLIAGNESYDISFKYYDEIKKIYKERMKAKSISAKEKNLEDLDDTRRAAKKYNL